MDHAEKYDIINLVRKNILRCYASTAMLISIHSLIRGRTTSPKAIRSALLNFNPLPHTRENAAQAPQSVADITDFNPLPHTRENVKCGIHTAQNGEFQSTPSYEGELVTYSKVTVGMPISIHSLIRGRTHQHKHQREFQNLFQSTPSYEGELFNRRSAKII